MGSVSFDGFLASGDQPEGEPPKKARNSEIKRNGQC